MEFKNILFQKEGELGIITINRPEQRNALDLDTRKEMLQALQDIRKDGGLRVLIITGSGEKAFASGADIHLLKEMKPTECFEFFEKFSHKLYDEIENLEIPVIAMIKGYCLGGGCELAAACDMRIASEDAKFGHPEVNLGLIPSGGATQRLPRLIGIGRAKELILTGQIIGAKEAERIGLVNRVVPVGELKKAVKEIASMIAEKGPISIKMAKKALNEGLKGNFDTAMHYEVALQSVCFTTNDHSEGIEAFLEKRKPEFKGE